MQAVPKVTYVECSERAKTEGTNSRWSTTLSKPLRLSPGDVISLDQAALCSEGADGDTSELTGQANGSGFVDNAVEMEFAFYANHTGRNSQRLPLKNAKTHVGPADVAGGPLRCRRLGLPDISATAADNEPVMPTKQLTFRLKLTKPGEQFTAGTVYSLVPKTSGASGSGMQIRILTVSESNSGIQTYEMASLGSGYAVGALKIENDESDTEFSLLSYPSDNFSTKLLDPPDGLRYFALQPGYSGPGLLSSDTGAPAGGIPGFALRTASTKITVPAGIYLPDTIGSVMTNTLQKPHQVTRQSPGTFVSLDGYTFGNSATPPLLIESPTSKLASANFGGHCTRDGSTSLVSEHKRYWESVCVQEPDLWQLSVLRNLVYHSPGHASNEISSGPNPVNNAGDFAQQTLGQWGLVPRLLTHFERSTDDANPVVILKQGGLLLTSILFTPESLQKIALAMHQCETLQPSGKMACPLDVSLIFDENSNGPLGHSYTARERFISLAEAKLTPGGITASCLVGEGTRSLNPDGTLGLNGTMPTLWCRSRFDEETCVFAPGKATFQELLANNSTLSDPELFPMTQGANVHFSPSNLQSYIAMARNVDLACVPIFPDPGLGYGDSGPFIAFVSDRQLGVGHWQCDFSFTNGGVFFGFDPSPFRHKQVFLANLCLAQGRTTPAAIASGVIPGASANDYQTLVLLGTPNPQISFDTSSARMSISNLHSAYTEGNGNPMMNSDSSSVSQPSSAPEQATFTSHGRGFIGPGQAGTALMDPFSGLTMQGMIIDAQSGVCLSNLKGVHASGKIGAPLEDNTFTGTLLDKLGFVLSDLLPGTGDYQARIPDSVPRLLTTNALVGPAQSQALSEDTLRGVPLYDIGASVAGVSSPDCASAQILALNAPIKMSTGVLNVYSDIGVGSATSYVGGTNSTDQPCVAIVSRSESAGDYLYGGDGFVFEIQEERLLTRVEVDCRSQDGLPARNMRDGSFVVFKIVHADEPTQPKKSGKTSPLKK